MFLRRLFCMMLTNQSIGVCGHVGLRNMWWVCVSVRVCDCVRVRRAFHCEVLSLPCGVVMSIAPLCSLCCLPPAMRQHVFLRLRFLFVFENYIFEVSDHVWLCQIWVVCVSVCDSVRGRFAFYCGR